MTSRHEGSSLAADRVRYGDVRPDTPESGGDQSTGEPATPSDDAADAVSDAPADELGTTGPVAPGLEVSDTVEEIAEVLDVTVETAVPEPGGFTADEDEGDTEVLGITIDNPQTAPVNAAAAEPTVELRDATLPRTGSETAYLAIAALASLSAGVTALRRSTVA